MNYLGSNRVITQDFKTHNQEAEDYAGPFLSDIKLNSHLIVTKIINRFKNYEDSINYNYFLQNGQFNKQGEKYNLLTLSGKLLTLNADELGGNQIWLEGYHKDTRYQIRLAHLGEVTVKVGDITNPNTLLGLQGNTGLVLSNKNLTDKTYGTHVHLEVTVNNQYVNPRAIADGSMQLLASKSSSIPSTSPKEEELPNSIIKEDIKSPIADKYLVFTCPKDDLYAINLKEKEQLYIIK